MAMAQSYYVIRGGVEGRERLRVLSRVMRPATLSLFGRAGIRRGMACLDVGCGGGDVSRDLAELVGSDGRIVGIDRDASKIELARSETALAGKNIDFRVADICTDDPEPEFDLVYVRFVLSHLPNPESALRRIKGALRPGGVLIAVDIDYGGYFCYPANAAVERSAELYIETVRRRGGDPHIGPRLPALLAGNGFERIQMSVVQLAGLEGEVKLLTPITTENIADAVLAEGLASREEIDQLIRQLYEYAHARDTVGSTPRIVETWGQRVAA